jgi:uncharacterized protein YjdB
LKVGEKMKLSAIFTPKNATNRGVTWGIEDKDVATIDFNGVVTARNVGTTTAYVITDYGFFEATCLITVVAESIIHTTTLGQSIS